MKLWILSTDVVGVVCGPCYIGWKEHDVSCYRIPNDTETWVDANNMCALDNAYLAEIGSERENTFIHGLKTDGSDIWLGGTDLSTEGEWKWVTYRRDMKYTKWRQTEPNNQGHDENCLEMDKDGLWNDRPCHNFQKYVCQKRQPLMNIWG